MTKAAYRIDGAVVEASAFYAAACDVRRSVVVEACAGAGKTWMLVSRIVRALLAGARPQDILAITFTRKAAGEMRARLNEWLREWALASAPQRVAELMLRGLSEAEARAAEPQLGALYEAVLAGGRSVEVRTFHAWFAQLLAQAPMVVLDDLGLQPGLSVVEDADGLFDEVWPQFLAAVDASGDARADFTELVRTRGQHAVQLWFRAAIDKRVEIELADEAGALESAVPSGVFVWPQWRDDGQADAALQAAPVRAVLAAARDALAAAGKPKKVLDAAAGLEAALACLDGGGAGAFELARQALFTKSGHFEPRKLIDAPELRHAVDLLISIGAAQVQHEAHLQHGRMVRLSRVLLRVYRQHKRTRGVADMADLERCALHLLRNSQWSGWVQERLDARIRHLLIDEFQDTSPLQWHALHAWLSSYAGAGGGQEVPSVFIVGDPKQSIYRFRRAEPRVFRAAADFVRDALDGRLLACDHTRRNAPDVIDAVNAVFESARRQVGYAGFRPHTTAAESAGSVSAFEPVARPVADRSASGDDGDAPWRDVLTDARDEQAESAQMPEARQVARAVAQRVAQGVPPGEIFVLSRKRRTLALVARALRELHVPHATPEGIALIDTIEVRDLVAVLDVLVSPAHDLSLAQALRSPIFRCSDDDLMQLAQAAGKRRWWPALMDTAWAEGSGLDRARVLLSAWREAVRHLPPHDLLARIVTEAEVRERVVAAVPPPLRALALERIHALLGQSLALDEGRYATPYGFVRELRRRAIEVPSRANADAVQLLTVHGAKGLEADVVFVTDTDPESQNPESSAVLVDWPAESAHPRLVAFVASLARCPRSLEDLKSVERSAQLLEEFNALYVAMTRAKRELVFSSTVPHRPGAGPGWPQVLQGHGWPTPAEGPAVPGAAADAAGPPVELEVLPEVRRPRGEAGPFPGREVPGGAAAIGQLVHAALEVLTALPVGARAEALEACLRTAAVRLGGLDEGGRRQARRIVEDILDSEACAPWLDPACSLWARNEYAVVHGGQVLRIDRLVYRDLGEGPQWWVLDYKIEHRPELVPEYREQLGRYCEAVRAAVQSEGDAPALVRAAFVTGAGAFVPL